jgi:hypothetical protein
METKFKVREQNLTIEFLMEQGMIMCGSPKTVVERLTRRHEEMDFGHLVTMLQFGTLPADLTERNIRMFASEVMPKLRPLGTGSEKAPAAVAE